MTLLLRVLTLGFDGGVGRQPILGATGHRYLPTLLGWAIAAIATGVPLLVGVVLGLRHP